MDLEGGVTGEKGGDKGHKGIIFRNNADMVLFLAVRFRSRGSYRIFSVPAGRFQFCGNHRRDKRQSINLPMGVA